MAGEFDFRGYDAWKCDSGREGEEEEDRSPYTVVVCERGHRRLVRDRATAGPCWTCKAWEVRPPRKEPEE
jgi:hypothetical protein